MSKEAIVRQQILGRLVHILSAHITPADADKNDADLVSEIAVRHADAQPKLIEPPPNVDRA
jgi:hypothetical protein